WVVLKSVRLKPTLFLIHIRCASGPRKARKSVSWRSNPCSTGEPSSSTIPTIPLIQIKLSSPQMDVRHEKKNKHSGQRSKSQKRSVTLRSRTPNQDPLIARNPRMRLEALICIFHNSNYQAWLIAVPDQQNLPSYGLHQASGSRNKTSSCPRGPCDSMSCVITVRPPTRAANKTRDALHGQTSERDAHEDDRETRLQQQQPLRPWQTLKPFQASHTATSDSLSPRRNARGVGVKLKSTN